MREPTFAPAIFDSLRGYSAQRFARDLTAGLTVGVVALPLALAFGIASIPEQVAGEAGLSPPVMGLFTAIVAGFLISALGGTKACIGGPTGAFVVIVYAIAAEHGYLGLVLATMLAGVMLIVLGAVGLGKMIKFIPYPVTTGFTAGIAAVIFSGQIRDFLGIAPPASADPVPPDFLGKIVWNFEHSSSLDPATTVLSLVCVGVLIAWPKIGLKKVPAPVVVLVGATAAAWALRQFAGVPITTIGDRFGAIPAGLPVPHLPDTTFAEVRERLPDLIAPAFTIAILAAIESLLCAVVADGMTGTRHRSNTELIAQGVANIASPLFGGMPATGAIARTATNIQAGGRTPIAGIVHAGVLLAIVLALGKYASLVPLCALAAVLVVVAYRMAEIHRFRWLLNGPRSDAAVLLTTFALTVLVDLTVAVQAGVVLAAILFIKRMADVSGVRVAGANGEGKADATHADVPAGVEVYDIQGPFFFGAAFKLRDTLEGLTTPPKVLVLNLEAVPAVDATGLHALHEMIRRSSGRGARVILAGAQPEVRRALLGTGILGELGERGFAASAAEAIAWLRAEQASGSSRTARG
ncbi:MAG: SulP family inorganic anion transporter [Phycisphaerales bacterium]